MRPDSAVLNIVDPGLGENDNADFTPPPRPRTRGECKDGPRPCPWFGCRFHLGLDLAGLNSTPRLTWPDRDVDELPATCALDLAARDGMTLDEVGKVLDPRERVRQIEQAALAHLSTKLKTKDVL
jgi:hypothetical protein